MAEMGKFIAEMTRAGVLVATGGLLPSATGARVRSTGGKLTVTDGPFTEAKELIGGYAIVRAGSKEGAVQQARRFLRVPGVADGECEVRQMLENAAEAWRGRGERSPGRPAVLRGGMKRA